MTGIEPTWTVLAWLLGSLALLALANRWFDLHLWNLAFLLSGDERVADFLHFAVLLPGVLLHELSHWLMARLLGLGVGRLELWPEPSKAGLRLGSVRIQQADPLRGSLVGMAPLLTGSLVLFLVGRQVFGLEEFLRAVQALDGPGAWAALKAALEAPDLWLWAYLIFAVANAMLPSRADRHAWRPLAVYAGILAGLYWLLAGSLPTLPEGVWGGLSGGLARLAATFNLTLMVDAVFGGVLFLVELALARLAAINERHSG
ncbi:MAG: hypothetical protein ACUVXG_10295 [Anaerolineae bacterium]